ncbi:Mak10 subunit, NatC N-terminal acetyltransferase-domain-containing protein [Dipodascopsis uninucleata]
MFSNNECISDTGAVPKQRPPALNYIDVTEVFRMEAQKIHTGRLVVPSDFDLTNAINALEMMDSKMDTGLLDMQSNDWKFDTERGQPPDVILWLMDELLSLEMSWHLGSSLTQTIFTCLYVEQVLVNFNGRLESANFSQHRSDIEAEPSDNLQWILLHVVFRAYVLGLIKACDICRRRLQCEEVMEEEDIITQTYGFDMLQFVPCSDVLSTLSESLETLHAVFRTSTENEKRILEAIITRMLSRKQMIEWLELPATEYKSIRRLLLEMESDIPKFESSHSLGRPLSEAFSIGIQGRLESNMPPRFKSSLDYELALDTYRSLIHGMSQVILIRQCTNTREFSDFFRAFSIQRPNQLPYTRSSLFRCFIQGGQVLDDMPIREVLISDINHFSPLSSNLMEVSIQHPAYEKIQQFYGKAEICYQNWFSIRCNNRSRLRQNLCGAILDWDSLQVDSEGLECSSDMIDFSDSIPSCIATSNSKESYIQPLPFSSWVYFRKLEIMMWVVFLGFDLDIYKLDEWSLMFWYGDYILGVLDNHLNRTQLVLKSTMNIIQENNNHRIKTSHKKEMRHKSTKFSIKDLPSSDAVLESLENIKSLKEEISIYRELSHSYICILAVLSSLGCLISFLDKSSVRSDRFRYTTPELLYNLRLKAFSSVGVPELPSFESYQVMNNRDGWDDHSLLNDAYISLSQARKKADSWTKRRVPDHLQDAEVRCRQSLVRSCIGINIAISQLKKMTSNSIDPSSVSVSIQHDKFHPFFPVISITDK